MAWKTNIAAKTIYHLDWAASPDERNFAFPNSRFIAAAPATTSKLEIEQSSVGHLEK